MANESNFKITEVRHYWSDVSKYIQERIEEEKEEKKHWGYFEVTGSCMRRGHGYEPLQVAENYDLDNVTLSTVIKMMQIRDKDGLTQLAIWAGHQKYYGSIWGFRRNKGLSFLFDRETSISWLKGDIVDRHGRLISQKPDKKCLELIQVLPVELLHDIVDMGYSPYLNSGKLTVKKK